MSDSKTPWLILFHQIPPKPDYLRVKIGRRLQRIGAVAVKNSVYVLPDRPESLEDFQWIRTEVVAAGGDASICRAAFVDGLTDERVADLFRAARDADYAEIAESARELLGTLRGRASDVAVQTQAEGELAKLRKLFAAVHAIDFCNSAGKEMADQTLKAVAQALEPAETTVSQASRAEDRSAYRGRVWEAEQGRRSHSCDRNQFRRARQGEQYLGRRRMQQPHFPASGVGAVSSLPGCVGHEVACHDFPG